jgi:hypothetical protein
MAAISRSACLDLPCMISQRGLSGRLRRTLQDDRAEDRPDQEPDVAQKIKTLEHHGSSSLDNWTYRELCCMMTVCSSFAWDRALTRPACRRHGGRAPGGADLEEQETVQHPEAQETVQELPRPAASRPCPADSR